MSSVGRTLLGCGALVLAAGCYFDSAGTPGSIVSEPGPDAALVDAARPDAARPDAALAPDASAPPAGYQPVDGQPGLYREVAIARSLAEAAIDCDDDGAGAHLLVIDDADEEDAIRGHVEARLEGRRVWLGISDEPEEGAWLTLALVPIVYDHWNSGEPNDLGDEDCAVMLGNDDPPGHRGRWNDTDCADQHLYLCEWSAD